MILRGLSGSRIARVLWFWNTCFFSKQKFRTSHVIKVVVMWYKCLAKERDYTISGFTHKTSGKRVPLFHAGTRVSPKWCQMEISGLHLGVVFHMLQCNPMHGYCCKANKSTVLIETQFINISANWYQYKHILAKHIMLAKWKKKKKSNNYVFIAFSPGRVVDALIHWPLTSLFRLYEVVTNVK